MEKNKFGMLLLLLVLIAGCTEVQKEKVCESEIISDCISSGGDMLLLDEERVVCVKNSEVDKNETGNISGFGIIDA